MEKKISRAIYEHIKFEVLSSPGGDADSDDEDVEFKEVIDDASSISDFLWFKKTVKEALLNYVDINKNFELFRKSVSGSCAKIFNQDVPYIVMRAALDMTKENRAVVTELIKLLLVNRIVTPRQVNQALQKLFYKKDELTLDIPKAVEYIGTLADFFIEHEYTTLAQFKALSYAASADELKAIKKQIHDLVNEYLEVKEMTVDELSKAIFQLNLPSSLYYEVVKIVVSMSLDRSDKEREMASQLLVSLTSGSIKDFIQPEDAHTGFSALLEASEELTLDVPQLPALLTKFIARAVVDEVLAPCFLVRLDLSEKDMGFKIVAKAIELLHEKEASSKLSSVWESAAAEKKA